MDTGMELSSTIQSFLLLDISFQTVEPCPSDLLTAASTYDYVLLGFDADRQCSSGRGGALCRGCALGFAFTFRSAMCVPQATYSWWQPYFILLFTQHLVPDTDCITSGSCSEIQIYSWLWVPLWSNAVLGVGQSPTTIFSTQH